MIPDNIRKQQVQNVVSKWLPSEHVDISMVAGDASFRKYYRLQNKQDSWVLMDAPPEQEDCTAFIEVTQRLRDAGLHAPEIFQIDLEQGFLLLEDLGDQQYKPLITTTSADTNFEPLFRVLEGLAVNVKSEGLPVYDQCLLQAELNLFPDWYLNLHKTRPFTKNEQLLWQQCCKQLIESAQQQSQVFVHRDFHSCNLMKTKHNNPGVIDYQDAVIGPISYDLVSLLWDRYISWPRPRIEKWCQQFRLQLGLSISAEDWQQQCDWMALQRNLKIVGIFCRLHYRDHKDGYLEMLPRFWDYCLDILGRYPEFADLKNILQQNEFQPEEEFS